jgi:hypothetical protein
MRCIECGEEMRLLKVVRDDSESVTGLTQKTFECPGCHHEESRLIFSRFKPSRTGRNVQIGRDPRDETAFAAKDTVSGLVVMRHQDIERLRELCHWIGWHVVDGRVSSAD